MPNLLMLKGLPGSGKSTWAKEHPEYVRVNMDSIREMLHDNHFTGHKEKLTQAVRRNIIYTLLSKGENVVVDDTNFHKKHEDMLRQMVKEIGDTFDIQVKFKVKFIDTPVEGCIKNDLKRTRSVGKDVIMRMYKQYLEPAPEVVEYDPNLPNCIIVDIDGTVALMNGRSPYDWDRVGEDLPNLPVIEAVTDHYTSHRDKIIFLSGRDEVCRETTVDWLIGNIAILGFELYMRPEGDNRPDTVVKKELYEQHIKGKFNVKFVLDDRDSVVKQWRQLGLTCLQVAEGDF